MGSNRDEPLTFINISSSPITVSDGDSYLLDPNSSQIGSASGSFQNEGLLGGDGGSGSSSDAEFGFSRPEFRQSQLAGTVQLYDRHVFLCYKNPQVWPSRIEAAEFDRLPRLLSAAVSARKGDMKRETRLTICEGYDGTETSNGDVLIFPDMIRYRRLTHFDVDTFVEEVLVKDGEWLPGTPETLKGSYIFVCSHGARDRRCGVCGPTLVTRFKEEIESHGLQGKVSVRPCSHIGGHKYAGNVIIFKANVDGEVSGHWYGYVNPDDVPYLLQQHILREEIVDWLWRGQMGLTEEEQKKFHELRLQLNGGTYSGRNSNESKQPQTDEVKTPLCGSQVESLGCCQENGNSCCQNLVLSENEDNPKWTEPKITAEDKKSSSKKHIAWVLNSPWTFTVKRRTMPTWYESWEREDTYAALAVVCAAASVALALSCYKQLR